MLSTPIFRPCHCSISSRWSIRFSLAPHVASSISELITLDSVEPRSQRTAHFQVGFSPSTQHVLHDIKPELSRQTQRLYIDALIIAVQP